MLLRKINKKGTKILLLAYFYERKKIELVKIKPISFCDQTL